MNVILSGFMGSGKTTIGKALAKDLGATFIDMDDYVEETSNMTIAEIFKKYGEMDFRHREEEAACELGKRDNLVIATGGGTMVSDTNAEFLKANGKVLYLKTSPDVMISRIRETQTIRPIVERSTDTQLKELYFEREPSYEKSADITIDCNDTPKNIVDCILNALKL